jgi:hypothetical protein
MEVIRELTRRPRPADMLAIAVFSIVSIYTIVRGTAHTILAGIAFVMIVLGALPRQVPIAFLVGAVVIMLLQRRNGGSIEGFTDGKKKEATSAATPAAEDGSENQVAPADEEEEAAAPAKPEQKEAFYSKPMLPDNATRKEPLVLGKPYKLPSEADDKEYHLDAGTTFLNAYKALKPDQIASMTKDTQELLSTQRSLVSMLDSFAPLLKDMNKITGFFGPQN